MVLIVTKALNFSWSTTMSLLFLSATNYQIAAGELEDLKQEFTKLNIETSKTVMEFYRSRKAASAKNSGSPRLPQLHAR